MAKSRWLGALASVTVLALGASAMADFSGQTILGPLGPGDLVAGDTTGHSDNNDGFDSGGHFFDLWDGPDDVWQLNWPGGDMQVEMNYQPLNGDLDLFLYEPGSYDSSGNYSVLNTGTELILAPGAPAGIYYLNVDGVGFFGDGDAGPYTLRVSLVPEPASLSLLAMGLIAVVRRNRRRS